MKDSTAGWIGCAALSRLGNHGLITGLPVLREALRLSTMLSVVAAMLAGGAMVAGEIVPYGGEIAFTSLRGGNYDIYLLDVGRLLTHNLTRSDNNEFSPDWSPDGQWIAFTHIEHRSEPPENANIYVMDANGRQMRFLADFGHDTGPEWSPDGNRIAFEMNAGIYVMDSDGKNLHSVMSPNFGGGVDMNGWSPDGKQIAYSYGDFMSDSIWIDIVTLDGTDASYTIPPPATGGHWSPDGKHMLFMSGVFGFTPVDLYVFDLDTEQRTRLTSGAGYDTHGDWTQDGRRIVFTSFRHGNGEIYMIDADGSNERRLTFHPASDFAPDWRPGTG